MVEGPGNAHPLALPAGQADPVLTHPRVQTVRELLPATPIILGGSWATGSADAIIERFPWIVAFELFQVAAAAAQLARRNPQYLQIRWIDTAGRERARTQRDGDEVRAAAAWAVSASSRARSSSSKSPSRLFSTVDQLSPQFQTALRGMDPGDVTDPIEGAAGYFVLKLVDRAAGSAPTYEQLEDRMRQAVFDQKLEQELEVFLGELRERFYIEVKA